jgi:hypothetical protein
MKDSILPMHRDSRFKVHHFSSRNTDFWQYSNQKRTGLKSDIIFDRLVSSRIASNGVTVMRSKHRQRTVQRTAQRTGSRKYRVTKEF